MKTMTNDLGVWTADDCALVLIDYQSSMLVGLVLLVTAVRLSNPSLALFLVGGGLIGAGAGAVFKGTTGLVLDGTAPENRVAMTAELLIALFVGLSVPVIGAGVALDRGASAPNTVLGFAVLVGLGVAGAGWGPRPPAEELAPGGMTIGFPISGARLRRRRSMPETQLGKESQ
jgi:hypothetical protein